MFDTIGKKLICAMGSVLFLLGVVAIWAVYGGGVTVNNASKVIYGNKLQKDLVQKEVDHLNWSNKVSELLTNDIVKTLNVQTDDHKCGFGKFLYGQDRNVAEERVPALKEHFKKN